MYSLKVIIPYCWSEPLIGGFADKESAKLEVEKILSRGRWVELDGEDVFLFPNWIKRIHIIDSSLEESNIKRDREWLKS